MHDVDLGVRMSASLEFL